MGGDIPGREPRELVGVLETLLYLDQGGGYKGIHSIKIHPVVHLRFVHVTRAIVHPKVGGCLLPPAKGSTNPGAVAILVL